MKNNDQTAATTAKPKRNKYTAQSLEQAKQDGVTKTAKDLGIAQAMLYSWQAKSLQTVQPFEAQKLQQAEIARLKRENARMEEEVAFLKRRQRTLPATQVRYAMMQSFESEFSIALMQSDWLGQAL